MFGLRKAVRLHAESYLQVIRPWAMGKDNRGWVYEDFFQHETQNPEADWVPIPEVRDYRTDAAHVIFPLLPYNISLLDRLFMSPRLLDAMNHLNQGISNFNAMRDVFTNAQALDARWNAALMLHTGLIGTTGTGGLHDRWNRAWRSL